MLNALEAGGWGMYPTLLFGLVLLGVSCGHGMKPDSRRIPLLGCLALLTLCSGMLGFITGLMATSMYVQMEPDIGRLVVQGVGESCNNLALAFLLLTLSFLAMTVGQWRASRVMR